MQDAVEGRTIQTDIHTCPDRPGYKRPEIEVIKYQRYCLSFLLYHYINVNNEVVFIIYKNDIMFRPNPR